MTTLEFFCGNAGKTTLQQFFRFYFLMHVLSLTILNWKINLLVSINNYEITNAWWVWMILKINFALFYIKNFCSSAHDETIYVNLWQISNKKKSKTGHLPLFSFISCIHTHAHNARILYINEIVWTETISGSVVHHLVCFLLLFSLPLSVHLAFCCVNT